MKAPDVLLVELCDERPTGGALAVRHTLRCAELRAALSAWGLSTGQLVEREVTTLRALVAATRRREARLVAIVADRVTPVAAALARRLDGAAPRQAVVGLGAPAGSGWPRGVPVLALGDAPALARRAGAADAPAPQDPVPSPWLLGLLPARAAAHVGVRADAPADRLAAELAWIERRSPLAQVVALHGPAAWADHAAAALRVGAIERAGLAYVRVAPRLDRRAGPAVAAALADTGAAELVLVADATGGDPELAPLLALARAGMSTDVRVDLRLSGDPAADEAWLRALAGSGLAFDISGEAGRSVVPELQRAGSFASRAAVGARAAPRLRRALEQCSPAAPRLVEHALDILWAHPDDPGRHADWLGDVLAASSTLAVLRPGRAAHRRGPLAAPAPLWRTMTIGVEETGAAGAATWHVEGEPWHIRPYADAPTGEPLRALVLTLQRREDLDAFVADADAANASGRPPAAAVHPRVTIAGLGTLSGDDPGSRLAHLVVDPDGLVRPAPGARALGRLGDPFDALRAAAFARRARHDALVTRHGGAGAPSVPEWLGDEDAVRLLAGRPHLRVVAHLPRLLRAVERPGSAPPAVGEVRVGGLGGPLAYDGPADPRRPLRRLVARVGERHAIYDLRRDRALVVGRDLAAICEALDATGDPPTVVGWLAAARNMSAATAGRAVATTVQRLQSAGLLDPAELTPQPAARPGRVRDADAALAPRDAPRPAVADDSERPRTAGARS